MYGCPHEAYGKYPNCVCPVNLPVYDLESNACASCPTETPAWIDNTCNVCPDGTIWNQHVFKCLKDCSSGYTDISTPQELVAFANDPSMWNSCVRLTMDIDMAGVSNMSTIGNIENKFTGVFNGEGHFIENLFISNDSSDYRGLFGYVSENALIENIVLHMYEITGKKYTGGLVGYNEGTVLNCSVKIDSQIKAEEYAGGIAGYNVGHIVLSNLFSAEVVSGLYAGGIAGYNSGYIYSATVDAGPLQAANYSGGLVGYNQAFGKIINSCSYTDKKLVMGSNYVGLTVGYNETTGDHIDESCIY